MVYSEAFTHMPKPLRDTVMRQMKEVLTSEPAEDNQPQVSASARKKILSILEETVEGWPKS